MEETFGYEALLSDADVSSVDLADWTDVSGDDEQGHEVVVGDDGLQLDCSVCGDLGQAESPLDAQAIARLHEAFVAIRVETWVVGS